MEWLLGLGLVWFLFSCVGIYVSNVKGRPAIEGLLFALLLGPIGVLVAALMPTVKQVHYAPRTRKRAVEEEEELPSVANWHDWVARG